MVTVLQFARALSINSRHSIKQKGGRTGNKATVTLPRGLATCELFTRRADIESSGCSVGG